MNPTIFVGFASLKTPLDLLQKIKHDFKRLGDDPGNTYAAFDFFVSSYHMIDWLHPNDRHGRDSEEKGCLLLQICSHIANGAKHFEATAKQHKSVSDVKNKPGYWNPDYWSKGYWNPNYFNMGGLFVYLDGDAANEFGSEIKVIDLAQKILKHWEWDPRLCP
jgi:hypothetical protein